MWAHGRDRTVSRASFECPQCRRDPCARPENRATVHRASSRQRFVGTRRVGHRSFRHERHDSVHLRIYPLDASQMRGHHISRRHVAPLETGRQFDGAEVTQIVGRKRRRLLRARERACRSGDGEGTDGPSKGPARHHFVAAFFCSSNRAVKFFSCLSRCALNPAGAINGLAPPFSSCAYFVVKS